MNILIVKTGALGDVARSTFLAQALKDKYSNNNPKIFWLTDLKAKPIFVNNPYVSRVVTLEDRISLKKYSFDEIINLEEDIELCKFISSLKFRRMMGFYYRAGEITPTRTAKEWFDMSALGKRPRNDILKKANKKTHRQILSEIAGINPHKYEPFLRLSLRQRAIAKNFLRINNLDKTDLIIGINTGAADRWPKALSIKKTAQLINKIYRRFGAKILLFGGPTEIQRNQELMKLINSPVIPTGCGNNLFEFPALISICKIFITTDTLGLHIALALKRKTICLLGPTSNSEIEMYGLGEKVIAKSNCLCCYNKDCKSMERINVDSIVKIIPKLIAQKITVLITAANEPKIGKAIESVLAQKTEYSFELVVSAPDKKTLGIARKYKGKSKLLRIIRDPGKGKSYALNFLFRQIDTDILILTDGDVFMSKNSVQDIVDSFLDPEIGCVTGRPVPVETLATKYGYWANFLFGAAHRLRQNLFECGQFIECSGYLFAFRKKFIGNIPLDVAEDAVIPYYFWERGYRAGYAPEAIAYVKNADNFRDWIKQKTRTAKAHETLKKYVNTKITPRVKSFKTEIRGIRWLFGYPSNLLEAIWTANLALARIYMWLKVLIDTKFKAKHYRDAWERVESTK